MSEILTVVVYAFGMFTVALTVITMVMFMVARLAHAIGILQDGDNTTILRQVLNNFN
jgi:hypothetical protein